MNYPCSSVLLGLNDGKVLSLNGTVETVHTKWGSQKDGERGRYGGKGSEMRLTRYRNGGIVISRTPL